MQQTTEVPIQDTSNSSTTVSQTRVVSTLAVESAGTDTLYEFRMQGMDMVIRKTDVEQHLKQHGIVFFSVEKERGAPRMQDFIVHIKRDKASARKMVELEGTTLMQDCISLHLEVHKILGQSSKGAEEEKKEKSETEASKDM